MSTYTFTCPIAGCSMVLSSELPDREQAANDLVGKATQHLQEVHPQVHKTAEQVNQDIRSLMVESSQK